MKNDEGDELDKLFKKGMEDPAHDPVYRETDWDTMEQMLDNRKKRAGVIYRLPWIGSAAALVLLALGWWLLKPQVVKNNGNHLSSVVKPTAKPNTGTGGGATRQKTADSISKKTPVAAGYTANPVHHGNGKDQHRSLPYSPVGPAAKLPVNSTAGQALASARKTVSTADKKEVAAADNRTVSPSTKNVLATTSPDKKEVASGDDKKEVATGDNKKGVIATGNTLAAAAPDKKEVVTGDDKKEVATGDDKKVNNNGNAVATNTPPAKVKITGKPNSGPRAIFAINALASSDVNGVNSLQGGRVGGNFGALFAVTIQKWTFSAGGMYSIKPYQVGFEDYHTAYIFKTNPSSVGANCKMLDIPFDVNYQLYNKGGNRFTIGTGLSSYIILREDYTFNYNNPYVQGPGGYSVINQNRNIFSILNLDATYEHRINSRFGIQFEPYLKLPLSNVGASQVRLQTAGVAVGLNWNLNTFKKPD